MKKWIKMLIIVGIVLVLGGIITLIVVKGLNTVKPGEDGDDDIAIESYLSFETNDDETGLIVSMLDFRDTPEKVIVPSEYDGLPVVEIGDGGFKYCGNIKELILPASITKIGKRAFANCKNLEKITLPFIGQTLDGGDKFASVFDESGMKAIEVIVLAGTTIEKNTFNSCSFIKSVTLPSTIKDMGNGAFSGATNLEKVVFEVDADTKESSLTSIGNEAFSGCTNLTSIEIPLSVTTIGEKAFYGCAKIASIGIPSSVTEIKTSTFENCTGLEVVTLRNTLEKIEQAAFKNCKTLSVITLPNSLVEIAEEAFMNCSSLKEVQISDNIKVIEKNTFKDCHLLNNVVLGNSLEIIKESAFEGCYRILSLTLPASLTTIETAAFADCAKITKLVIPASLVNFDNSAFKGCLEIVEIEVDENHPNLKEVNGYLVSLDGTELIMYPNALIKDILVIPDTIKVIKAGAFSNTTALLELTIPSSVELIEKGAFVECTSLTKLTTCFIGTNEANSKFADIFDSVPTSLKTLVFTGSKIEKGQINTTILENITLPFVGTSLTEAEDKTFVTIFESVPTALKEIVITNPDVVVDGSFKNLTNLETIQIQTTSIGNNAFANCSNLISFNSLEDVINLVGVVVIGEGAFAGASSIKKVELDSALTEIKNNTFSGNTALETIDMAKITKAGESAFAGCSSLTEVHFSKDVELIGEKAFANCTALTTIDIPLENENYVVENGTILFDKAKTVLFAYLDVNEETSYTLPTSVVRIAPYAFAGNMKLEEVIISDATTEIGAYAFFRASNLQTLDLKNVDKIGENALAFCNNLKSVNINSLEAWLGLSFETVEQNPLSYAKVLLINGEKVTELEIPSTITEISKYAFTNCTSIEKVTFTGNVTKVGGGAFNNCTNLTELTLSDSIEYIPEGLLNGCTSLKKLTIPFVGDSEKDATQLHQYPFGYIFGEVSNTNSVAVEQFYYDSSFTEFVTTKYYIPTALKEVTVLKGTINFGAFANIKTLTTITLQDEVSEIRLRAFEGCEALSNIVFGRGLTLIDEYAFHNCTGLKEVFIPKNVLVVEKYAFAGCSDTLFKCEADEKPLGWLSDWNSSNKVIWGQKRR